MDKLKTLYIDMPSWDEGVKVDDFLIAIGKKQSNSVYHVASVKCSPRKDKRLIRYNMKVYKSDLVTAYGRGKNQRIIPLYWYSRDKKK